MNDLPDPLEQLVCRVDALEKRVHDLENPAGIRAATTAAQPTTTVEAKSAEEPESDSTNGALAVLGKAMLGIAGAYALRALAASNLLPRQVTTAAAVLYAFAWLAVGARVDPAKRFAGAMYAGTSVLIFVPMLWELTLRFNILSANATAALLCAFAGAATGLAWKREQTSAFWMSYTAAALTALALMIASQAIMPFLLALLGMVLVGQYLGLRQRAQAVAALVAIAADVAVWILIYLNSSPQNAAAGITALSAAWLPAPGCALFLMSATSIGIKTLGRLHRVRIFDSLQATIAFVLAALSLLVFDSHAGTRVVGIACLLLAAVCYLVFTRHLRAAEEPRSRRVFAVWAAGLLPIGMFLLLPPQLAAVTLGLAGVCAIFLGVRLGAFPIELNGVIYLSAATAASGLVQYAYGVLAGSLSVNPDWTSVTIALCAVLCYASVQESEGENWQHQALHFISALLAALAVLALLAHGLVALTARLIVLGDHHLALVRTIALCVMALSLALGGAVWHRPEMKRIAYLAMALVALKLLLEDMRHGHLAFTAASISLFAITLIAVPRVSHLRDKI